MKKLNKSATIGVLVLGFFLLCGTAFAATEWSEDNIFLGTVNWFKKGIKIGQQGSGGVTFFNGTIVNQTTNDGVDNPVTFGDNVRIDGAIQRGHNRTGDTWNVKIADGVEVDGASTFKETVTFENGASGLDYAASSHNHDSTYYTETESDGRFVSKSSPAWDSQTGYYNLNYSNIMAADEDNAYSVNTSTPYGMSLENGSIFYLPLNLPNGVEIQAYRLYAYDANITGDMEIKLYKEVVDPSAVPTITQLGSTTSTSSNTGAQTADDTLTPFVTSDTSTTNYRFEVKATAAESPGQELRFYSIRVIYGITSPN